MKFEDSSDAVWRRIIQRLEKVVDTTTEDVASRARMLVRVDESPTADDIVLRDSIKTEVEGLTGIVYVEGDAQNYALVQEYGHPLYPTYGFTPYMRPALVAEQNGFFMAVRRALQ